MFSPCTPPRTRRARAAATKPNGRKAQPPPTTTRAQRVIGSPFPQTEAGGLPGRAPLTFKLPGIAAARPAERLRRPPLPLAGDARLRAGRASVSFVATSPAS